MISADKHSFHYSDEQGIQNWETQNEENWETLTQSGFLSFELYVHQSNEKWICFVCKSHTVIDAKRVYDIFS